jgi:hypothetical protein
VLLNPDRCIMAVVLLLEINEISARVGSRANLDRRLIASIRNVLVITLKSSGATSEGHGSIDGEMLSVPRL